MRGPAQETQAHQKINPFPRKSCNWCLTGCGEGKAGSRAILSEFKDKQALPACIEDTA